MKNCIIIQSGGPTTAINASLAGVIHAAREAGYDHIYGAVNGIVGVLSQNVIDLSERVAADDRFLEKLVRTPAMYLGSCRMRMPDPKAEPAIYDTLYGYFRSLDVKAFFGIGGNDSMDTVAKLSSYFNSRNADISVIGVPKTIDNDLFATDHTPGFGSAAKYVATSMREMAYDTMIYPVKSITIVEIMGRDSGWLTAASALARTEGLPAPQLIYLPEVPFSVENCIADTKQILKKRNSVMIAVSEGIKDKDGEYIASADAKEDKFGHKMLSGTGKAIEHILGNALGIKIRSVELNIPQRCGIHLASKTDLDEAYQLGEAAVLLAKEGISGRMVVIERKDTFDYQVGYSSVPVSEVANGIKKVPREWINERGNDVTEEMISYLSPLIQGEVKLTYSNGLPEFLPIDHLTDTIQD
ncbi:MAG: 6-phosphofructokinase [Lachnospiraceae bacterium]|nr:6-phosphofructokinase [Lachnospiraceae bacterium]